MNGTRILSLGATIGVAVFALLGGLALVLRSLRHVDLTLELELRRDDKAGKEY